MIRVLVIPFDPIRDMEIRDIIPDLDTMRGLVGGYLEVINLFKPNASLYLNEEGKLRGLFVNPRATAIWWRHRPEAYRRDYIVGDAFICGPPKRNGEDSDVPAAYLEYLDMDNYR